MSDVLQILSVENVSISYGALKAVEGVNFDVRRGEIYGLMGLNGAGKTSLIKSMLGLRSVNDGQIRIFGMDPKNERARLNLAYLPERFSPAWFLTGLEFIKFSMSLYNENFNEGRVLAMAEKIALDPKALKRRVQTYSKGMRQKAGLIATILSGREFLILDEPMSGLDPLARSLVKDVLMGEKQSGRTIFLSSHILADMDEICDRVGLLDQTRMQFIGTPASLKAKTGDDTLERAFLHSIVQRNAA